MTRNGFTRSHTLIAALAAAGALALTGPAMADSQQAVATAAQHAGFAAKSGTIKMVHTHLHHVLNCLVGPNGNGFYAAAGNPCGGTGGAIPQATDAKMKMMLQADAAEARTGLADNNLAAAQKVANDLHMKLMKKN